jgi:hypothetical protein
MSSHVIIYLNSAFPNPPIQSRTTSILFSRSIRKDFANYTRTYPQQLQHWLLHCLASL